jgi:hypothetical protein
MTFIHSAAWDKYHRVNAVSMPELGQLVEVWRRQYVGTKLQESDTGSNQRARDY